MSDPALSPDGREVAVAYANNIGVINVKTGELTAVYTGPTKNNPTAEQPHWSPSGAQLIFVADMSTASQEALHGHVYTVAKTGSGLKELSFPLASGQTRIRNISYSPSGRRVVYVSYNNLAKEGRIYTARLDGTDRQFIYADPAGSSATTALRDTIYSPDGSSILFRRRGDPFEVAVHRIPASGGTDLQLTDEEVDPGSNDGGTWLPNGSEIAYSNDDYRNEEPGEEVHVKVMDADGENPERLLTGFFQDWDPSFRQPELDGDLEGQELLGEYAPILYYDTQESYRTDSPAEITDLWGSDEGLWAEGEDSYTNSLWSGGLESESAQEIARSSPDLESGQFPLALGVLGSKYPSELEAREDDWVDERNDHYAEDAQELEVRSGYVNQDYGHAVADLEGNLWLEYWFFYYYDSSSVMGLSTGSHEGDWEMMMVKLDSSRAPVEVVYAQHKNGTHCAWGEIENSEGRPIGYVASGTHATYPAAGSWDLNLPFPLSGSDHADGEGGVATPVEQPIGEGAPSWVAWPGRWGGTNPGEVSEEIGDANSPVGPAFHSQWTDPGSFAEDTGECLDSYEGREARAAAAPATGLSAASAPAAPAPAAPEIRDAAHAGRHVVISYELPAGIDRQNATLVLSVNPAGGGAGPLTEAVSHPRAQGRIRLPFLVGPKHRGVVLASLVEGHGRSRVVAAAIE